MQTRFVPMKITCYVDVALKMVSLSVQADRESIKLHLLLSIQFHGPYKNRQTKQIYFLCERRKQIRTKFVLYCL